MTRREDPKLQAAVEAQVFDSRLWKDVPWDAPGLYSGRMSQSLRRRRKAHGLPVPLIDRRHTGPRPGSHKDRLAQIRAKHGKKGGE